MTEEKDFWINKDEVGILHGVEGTEYKVKQEMMNQKGWYKLADDETVVKKVKLSEEEVEFMEKNKSLVRFSLRNECFEDKVSEYAIDDKRKLTEVDKIYRRLSKAYYNGYTVKKEPRYYIKFPAWQTYEEGETYLNVDKADGTWELDTKDQIGSAKCQFTQAEIDELQKDERAKGLDLNILKVEVPEDELED